MARDEDIARVFFKGVMKSKKVCEFHERCRRDLHVKVDCDCAWEMFGWIEECVRRKVQYLKGKESGA